MVKVDEFNHEVKRVYTMQSSDGVPFLVCVDCCDNVGGCTRHTLAWRRGPRWSLCPAGRPVPTRRGAGGGRAGSGACRGRPGHRRVEP